MIQSVSMINWRAYEKRTVEFGKGITFIMGVNGSGKTSILEAIAYALTGETALFDRKTRPQLLRDPEQPAKVILRFAVDDNVYEIQRLQNPRRAGEAWLVRLRDQKRLANTQIGTTKQVEKLLGVSEAFMRRIVYMAEGDVFNFIHAAPKEALDHQIRSILGLTQLRKFSFALSNANKRLKKQLKPYQNIKEDLERLQIRNATELENHIRVGEKARQDLIRKLEKIAQELQELEQQTNLANKLQSEVDRLHILFHADSEKWSDFVDQSLQSGLEQFQDRLSEIEQNLTRIRIKSAHFDGQKQAYQRILELLKPYEKSTESVHCPVCRKPLTPQERTFIRNEIDGEINALEEQRAKQRQAQNELSMAKIGLEKQFALLRPIHNLIAHTELPDINIHMSYRELTNAIRALIKEEAIKRQQHLSQERLTTTKRLRELEAYQSEYLSIRKRLRDFGFDSPQALLDELVRIEVRLLSIRAASQATETTLATQQRSEMRSIYQQIAGLWSNFTGIEDWSVEMDMQGYPFVINSEYGLELDLRQLSGGEKTTLLILLHTIMAHHFSKNQFLMIDEPFEHLDAVNRSSLLQFLVEAYQHQVFNQALIATCEEELVREYQSSEGMNVVTV
jgi:DNA repair exonuclease SbcCD ATPase subunit